MLVKDALKVFKTRAGIAKALGGIRHRSAVYQWDGDGLVPLGAAFTLAATATGIIHKLRVNHILYEKQHKKRHKLRTK